MLPVKQLLAAAVIFMGLDFIYLSSFSGFFGNVVQKVQHSPLKMRFAGAALCYVALLVAFYYFILRQRRSVAEAFLLGVLIYAVFETTNLALFKDWPWTAVVLDTTWGGILFASTTAILKALRF